MSRIRHLPGAIRKGLAPHDPVVAIGALLCAGILAGCASQSSLTINPASAGTVPAATARYQAGLSGGTLFFPLADMPQSLQQAKSLKIVLGSYAIPMTMASATESMAPVPATTPLDPDLDGKQRFVFVLDRSKSELVEVTIR